MKKNSTYHTRGLLIDGFNVRNHPNYVAWNSMKSRLKPDAKCFKNYAGRGIDMDPRWVHFANFCSDMGIRPGLEFTLDRKDNDRGYWPDNCRWATRTEQCLNRRTFVNSKSGSTGVIQKNSGRFYVKYTVSHHTVQLPGTFATVLEAEEARKELVSRLNDDESIEDLMKKKVKHTSKSGIRGLSGNEERGWVARAANGRDRVYLGYFKNKQHAIEAISNYEKTRD
jgi:hypothetical protein